MPPRREEVLAALFERLRTIPHALVKREEPLRFGPLYGQVRKDGQPLGRVVAAEIGYANTLDRIETIRSDGMIEGAEPTAAACTGSITVRFDGTALFEAATTGTPVALDFGYLRDASTSLLIAVHEAWLSRPGLAIEGPAGIQATFEFQGAGNAALGRMATVTLTNDVEMLMSRKIGRGESLAPTQERRYGLNPAAGAYR